MTKHKYRLKYHLHLKDGVLYNKEIIIDKCMSEIHAKVRLNDYCKKNYPDNFMRIEISSIKEEYSVGSVFGKSGEKYSKYDQTFNDMFGSAFDDLFK